MTVEVFSQVYNEEKMLPHFIKFYKKRFSNIRFTIADNDSTDNTTKLARELGCYVVAADTGGEIRDDLLTDFKNNIWKGSSADWIIVCDMDEFLDINEDTLKIESSMGTTLIRAEGYDMVSDTFNPDTVVHGIRNEIYDKFLLFRKDAITEINYHPGAHQISPQGRPMLGWYKPPMFHMKYLGLQNLLDRYGAYKQRLSEINKTKGWGWEYDQNPEQITEYFNKVMKEKSKVR